MCRLSPCQLKFSGTAILLVTLILITLIACPTISFAQRPNDPIPNNLNGEPTDPERSRTLFGLGIGDLADRGGTKSISTYPLSAPVELRGSGDAAVRAPSEVPSHSANVDSPTWFDSFVQQLLRFAILFPKGLGS